MDISGRKSYTGQDNGTIERTLYRDFIVYFIEASVVVRQSGRFDNWDDILGREWSAIEGLSTKGSSGLVHRVLRAFAGDIGDGAAKGFV